MSEHKISREGWARGPWDDEPDRLEWRSAAGYPALIVRNPMGALCGYAAVPPGHPCHGVDHYDLSLSVHGGLTYSEHCQGEICHVPAPGEPGDVWWFGFDCGHGYDAKPGIQALFAQAAALDPDPLFEELLARTETYRTIEYVRAQVEALAAQLAAMAAP